MTRSTPDFSSRSLHIEGSLLPADYLRTVALREAPFQADEDYDLPRGLTGREEIGRAWRIATALWQEAKTLVERNDALGEKLWFDRWQVPLLRDVLGWRTLEPVAGASVADRSFPVTHRGDGGIPLLLTAPHHPVEKGDPRFGEEGRRRSPMAALQEYCNAAPEVLWGVVSDGRYLRLVRDNPSLTRPAWIEADLERLFEEADYADFSLFWLLFSATRLRPRDGDLRSCPLEQWRMDGQKTGDRAREKLRLGVMQALQRFGEGFLKASGSGKLRERLASGALSASDYHRQLLRLIYRLLLLFGAEDRDLIFAPDASAENRALYAEGYSLGDLRHRALRRRAYDRHGDLWARLRVLFRALADGAPALGIPALGGLFAPDQCPDLDGASLANAALLEGIFHLAYFSGDGALARVNYRDLDTEELGSVYESLLELHPRLDMEAWAFGFLGVTEAETEGKGSKKGKGSDRKLTGSYYTPPSLVRELISSALLPRMAEALAAAPSNPREALLTLKVVDPACGSGHFLLAAARALAAEVARVDGAETDERVWRHALREVVRHCIYGVDKNPLAVELCKAALWMETLEPGKPLSFLDAHIRCGDSLVGVLSPDLLDRGIPDEAYKALSGDDKGVSAALKKNNKTARQGVLEEKLFGETPASPLAGALRRFDDLPEESIADVHAKEEAWKRACDAAERAALPGDLFAAAFFAPKKAEGWERVPETHDLVRARQGQEPRSGAKDLARRLAREQGFFHWPVAFPEVFARGGFDVVVGNPPWERIKLQEQEFFASRSERIAEAKNQAERHGLIAALSGPQALPGEQALARAFEEAKRAAEAASLFAHESGRFPLTGVGDVNTYALFAETCLALLNSKGRAGIILPTGIATDDSTKAFFDHLVQKRRLASLFDFENREGLFPAVDSRQKFCLLSLASGVERGAFVFFATVAEQLADGRRRFSLTPDDIGRMNPNTRTCPLFRTREDAALTTKIYGRVPVLVREDGGAAGNPWGVEFLAMFHMSNDSALFRTGQQLAAAGAVRTGADWVLPEGGARHVPLYEAKMIHHYDPRWSGYEPDGEQTRDSTDEERTDPAYRPAPRYWVPEGEVNARLAAKRWPHEWLLGWRDICRATDERTVIASVVPLAGTGDTLLLMFPKVSNAALFAPLVADQSSLVHDYVARQKIGGTHLKYHVKKQITVLPPSFYTSPDLAFLVPRVLELTYTLEALRPFARDLGSDGPPFLWDPERRALLRAELDAWYAAAYGLTRDELRYVLDPADVLGADFPGETFRVLKEREQRTYGEYRTARLVLAAWDHLEAQGALPLGRWGA